MQSPYQGPGATRPSRPADIPVRDRLRAGPSVSARNIGREGRPDREVEDAPRSAGDVDRDAKASAEVLKALLKSQPPWSREVEFHRQKARNFYLTLLFAHPLSTHSQSLEPLWLNTSYSLIAAYRDAVSRAEATLSSTRKKGNRMGDPEFRKIMTRFRQALASDESFYRNLIGRIVAFYKLQDLAQDPLTELSISVPESVEGGGVEHGLAPTGKDEAEEKLGLVYKALICLGDIERYKDQYSERARREKEGGAKTNSARDKDELYGRARMYYEVARGLIPDDGSSFNQLAVISTYLSDDFQTTYYYFRALAVRVAFKNGEDILGHFLKKLFDKWRAQTDDAHPGDDVERCKREVLVVAAILYRKSGLSLLRGLLTSLLPTFSLLLANRLLPSEIIVKLTVIAIGTHWHARGSASLAGPTGDSETGHTAQRKRETEEAALDFLLSLFIAMLDTASEEVEEAIPQMEGSAVLDEGEDELGLQTHITAVLRRILPPMRIMSKWLKLHLDYLPRFSGSTADTVQHFWACYDRLVQALRIVFPIHKLPSISQPLEEDIDMRGFLPLYRGLSAWRIEAEKYGVAEHQEVHPNEEQLMRISDLLVDARLISQAKVPNAGEERHAIGHAAPSRPGDTLQSSLVLARDDELASVSTETDDDPVNLAMRATLAEDSVNGDADEEVILWGAQSQYAQHYTPSAVVAPQAQVQPQMSHTPTAYDLLQNLLLDNASPQPGSHTPSPHPASHKPSPQHQHQSRGSEGGQGSPALLFGGDAGGIWRMTREESEKGAKRAERAREDAQHQSIKAIWTEQPSLPAVPAPPIGLVPPPAPSGLTDARQPTQQWGADQAVPPALTHNPQTWSNYQPFFPNAHASAGSAPIEQSPSGWTYPVTTRSPHGQGQYGGHQMQHQHPT